MNDVQDGFRVLLHSICRFLVIVVRYDQEQEAKGQKLNKHLKRAMAEFDEYVLPILSRSTGSPQWVHTVLTVSVSHSLSLVN